MQNIAEFHIIGRIGKIDAARTALSRAAELARNPAPARLSLGEILAEIEHRAPLHYPAAPLPVRLWFARLGAADLTVAYEIPLLLTVLAISFMTGSLSLVDITGMQAGHIGNWFIWKQPLAFLIFLIAMFGETNRAPFDLAEAESELTAGFHTEYSSMGFGLFFMAEYGYMVVMCSVCSVLFLGGFHGPIPGIEGWWWMLIKTYALLFVMIWARWTFPRVRFDQLLNINWKWLLPLATANLLATALIMKL